MDRDKAVEYKQELSQILQNCAGSYGKNEEMAKRIIENFVEFLPESKIKGIIFLQHDPISYKFGNVRLDFKQALAAGFEFVASVSNPESIFNYIQLLLVSIVFIRNATKQPLGELEAMVVYMLHTKEMYTPRMEEERFICAIQKWYFQKKNKKIEYESIVEAINHLYDMETVGFNNGKIFLKESVWGRME